MKQKLLLLAILVFAGFAMQAQGVTTSNMNGRITDQNGDGLPGATVIAVHTPTGTQYGNITSADGYYRIPNMRVGGPYKITISFVGYQTFERDNVYLSLGQTFQMSTLLSEDVLELEGVEIVANQNDIFDGNRTGAETVVNLQTINETPTIGRAIGDFARFTPQARIEEGGDGFEISIAGMNNRFNAIFIDGAVNNDVFGLAASGTNGGQTGVSPYPIDAIEQFNIAIAPFDVRQSGFAGGSINAVTRSGTNNVEGSAYYYFRNESFAGKTPAEDFTGVTRDNLPDFTAKTYGLRVGGPIVKDKVFFFLNAEVQRDETPQPYDISTYNGAYTAADINTLISALQSTYGYDPGPYDNNTAFLDSDKIIGKLDFNLSDNHKLSVRHSYVKSDNVEARRSSSSSIQFLNGSEQFLSKTNSSSIELRSNFANMSNRFIAGFTFVRDDRDPSGNPFPSVTINDNGGRIIFGAEPFSTANLLNQDAISFTNNVEFYKGKHTIVVGANAELYKAKNLFIAFNFGNYEWDRGGGAINGTDLADFLAGEPADTYFRNYSQVDNITGDESGSAVEFNSGLFGIYVQDEIQASDKLKLTVGLRADIQTFSDTPENTDFNNNTLPQLEAVYDLQGARTGDFIDPQIYVAPRVGFNYDVTGQKTTQIRGGIGVFTSRIPLVWPGGAFNNNGINLGGVFSPSELFNPDVDSQNPTTFDPNNLQRGGDVDLFASDFKIPQVLKFNVAVDHKLPGDIIATVEFLYNDWINNIFYQNVNLAPPVANLTGGADNRPIYDGTLIDGTYNRVNLATNIAEGYTYNASLSLRKNFQNGMNASINYSYGDARNVFEGTSSQNSSQWRYRQTVSSRNFTNNVMRSQFAQGSRLLAQFSYRKEYAGVAATQIGLVWEGRSGNPYSYIIGNGNRMIDVSDSRTPELVYIPRNNTEINMPAADYAILDAFIESDDYLKEHRGEYAERNMNRTPFESILDLRLLQDFYIEMSSGTRNTLQLSLDIFNIGNILNKEWGKIYSREDGRFDYALYDFESYAADGTTPIFSANTFTDNEPWNGDIDDSGVRSSRWQMQIGVRYIFGN